MAFLGFCGLTETAKVLRSDFRGVGTARIVRKSKTVGGKNDVVADDHEGIVMLGIYQYKGV